MRILYAITELDIGGAERMLHRLAVGIAARGHEVTVACLSGRGVVGKWLETAGIRVHYLDARLAWPPAAVTRLRRLIRTFGPDVLHTVLFHANLAGRWAGRLERVPAIVCSVRVEEVERPWRLWLDGWTQGMMQAETCVSESARQFTHRRSGIPLSKLVTIPNGVEMDRFNLSRGAFRTELGIGPTAPLLVSVGRLERQKGTRYLIEAMAQVRDRFPEAILVLVGSGPDEAELKARARNLAVDARIRFVGWRPDVPRVLVDADLFILASLWEGMPNVVLEAMAARCAVVASSVGGCPDLVVPSQTGVLVPPGQSDALAGAIRDLLEQPETLKAMGEAGRRRAEVEFGVDKMIASNEALYRTLLDTVGRVC
ncbi:MAG: glycosyltransferase [Planctomycetes bacterium]|nr:glycosyltransferase [Planctomycetota bacterium]